MEPKCFWVAAVLLLLVEGWPCDGCWEEERVALLQLRHFFNTTFYLNDWVQGEESSDCCLWERVECDTTTGRVKALDLSGTRDWTLGYWYLNVSLFLPFHELQNLSLSYNQIGGVVENEGFEKLSRKLDNVEVLDLSNNAFNNSILSSLMGFSSLKSLDLKLNMLEMSMYIDGLHWKNLEYLNMYGNGLGNDFLPTIGNLTSLRGLSLSFSGLNGTLPIQGGLCELIHLEELDISYNDLSGALPWCLANLTSLQSLNLQYNYFFGDIAQSPLKSLTSIQMLSLSDNHFQIPISFVPLFNHSKLKEFLSYNNEIYTKMEAEIHSLGPKFQLSVILLSCFGISGPFPKFLYHQHDLEFVDLSHIHFVGEFPYWLLENNKNLQHLRLVNNSLSGNFRLPFHSHASLTELDVSNNMFAGHIPTEIGSYLPRLEDLYMSRDAFDGSIPSSFGAMKNLSLLDLSDNNLTGGIPDLLAIGCLSLESLILSNNRLQGPMFPSNFNLRNLELLQADSNHFIGEIPNALSNSSFLRSLDVGDNQLSGLLPSWMGNMSFLEEIMMPNNLLEGPIPSEFCKLKYELLLLDFSKNSLSGSLPSCSNPMSVQLVHLSKNKLQGSLTIGFFSSPSLVTLDLSNNQLAGNIRVSIDGLPNLSYLLLNNNSFEGDIPIQLCQLNKLSLIDLSHNSLSGRIPHCLTVTTYVEASSRPYDDHVPVFIAPSPAMVPISSPSRPYDDHVPVSIAPFPAMVPISSPEEPINITTKSISYSYHGRILTYMSGIDLSCNKLTGEIPYEIGNLGMIRVLNFSHNSLSGQIPPTFSNLKQVESLDLSYNNLSGSIPRQLIGLNFLSTFKVAYNNLSGMIPEGAQFATFDESSYKGNPLLCGDPLPKSCLGTEPREASTENKGDVGLVDMECFYVSFFVSYAMVLLSMAAVFYINPYWRRTWFNHIELGITSCLYFMLDNLPKTFWYR